MGLGFRLGLRVFPVYGYGVQAFVFAPSSPKHLKRCSITHTCLNIVLRLKEYNILPQYYLRLKDYNILP